MAEATTPAVSDAASIVAALGITNGSEADVDTVSAEAEGSEDSGAGTVTESGGEGEREGADEAAAEGAEPDAAVKPPADGAKRPKLADLTTDEALKTPEGIKAAAAAIRQATMRHHEAYRRTVLREREAKAATQQATAREQNYQRLTGGINSTLNLLQQGTPEQALHALGVLRGKAGIDAYEELTSTVIGIKKNAPAPADQKVQELQAKIAEIETGLQRKNIDETTRTWQHNVASQVVAKTAEGALQYPAIAHFVNSGKFTLATVIESVDADQRAEFERTKTLIPEAQLIANIEKTLADLLPVGAPAAAKPAARPAGRLPGRGMSPARAASAAGSRELTEEERMAELANDPDVMRALGF
jgi:hypothetical protein